MKSFYITTPIYYPSGKLHLGHAYTTIAGDVIKKYHQQLGEDVFYLTGSDEHGEKIEQKAKELNMQPKEYVDEIVDGFKKMWKTLEIDYDKFIRTTDEDHMRQVKFIFNKLLDNGDIYLGEYIGLYCTSCESYFTEIQANDSKCPDCGKKLKELKEESYFFKCSKYVDRLIEHLENNEDFLRPKERKNEIINNFIKPGLQDLAVSRTNFSWGITIDSDPKHVVYVWIDALTNYITALGYVDDHDNFKKYWPADVQLLGKEITRFHVIYWPMILMALDIELPKNLFAHGWLLMDRDKMSKSKGNIIYPEFLVDRYGVDTIRYYLMREVPFGTDGMFTPESYIKRINNDLVNDIGNLVNRTIAMCNKYFNGEVHNAISTNIDIDNLIVNRTALLSEYKQTLDQLMFSKNLQLIWKSIGETNKLIDLTTPWVLFKNNDIVELESVMYTLLSQIELFAVLLAPYMRNMSKKIMSILQVEDNEFLFDRDLSKTYKVVENPEILFNRLDEVQEIEFIQAVMDKQKNQAQAKINSNIEFSDFEKVNLVIGEIISVQKHDDAQKLLILSVDLGDFGKKQIVTGIAEYYNNTQLINKKIVVVNNLSSRKIRGIESEGMLLTTGEKKVNLVFVDNNHENGSILK